MEKKKLSSEEKQKQKPAIYKVKKELLFGENDIISNNYSKM